MPRELNRQEIITLRKVLADLFPNEEDSRMLVDDAGIPKGGIAFDSAARRNWHSIISEAGSRGMIPNLIQAALNIYEEHIELKKLHDIVKEEKKIHTTPDPLSPNTKTNELVPSPSPSDEILPSVQLQNIVRELIAQGKLENAINLSLKYIQEIAPQEVNKVIMLSARYKDTNNDLLQGKIDRKEATIERNNIRHSLLLLVDSLEADNQLNQKVEDLAADLQKTESVLPEADHLLQDNKVEIVNGFERIQGVSRLVSFSWITKLLTYRQTVGRIRLSRGYGTGFLLKGGYLLTNQHVFDIHNNEFASRQKLANGYVEFNVTEEDAPDIRRYSFDPDFYLFSPVPFKAGDKIFQQFPQKGYYDYALVKLVPNGLIPINDLGHVQFETQFLPHVNDLVSIIQYPRGDIQKFALADNQVSHPHWDHYFYYNTDTDEGSSGAPVFNKHWKVVAIHHYGQNEKDDSNFQTLRGGVMVNAQKEQAYTNRGILISYVLTDIQQKAAEKGIELPFLVEATA